MPSFQLSNNANSTTKQTDWAPNFFVEWQPTRNEPNDSTWMYCILCSSICNIWSVKKFLIVQIKINVIINTFLKQTAVRLDWTDVARKTRQSATITVSQVARQYSANQSRGAFRSFFPNFARLNCWWWIFFSRFICYSIISHQFSAKMLAYKLTMNFYGIPGNGIASKCLQ